MTVQGAPVIIRPPIHVSLYQKIGDAKDDPSIGVASGLSCVYDQTFSHSFTMWFPECTVGFFIIYFG